MKLVSPIRGRGAEWPAPGTPAAYLARFSNDDSVDADQSSVTRQGDFSRGLAERQQWPMVDAFVDDGISGAEFAARPEFTRLMTLCDDAITGRRAMPFRVLILSELSRLGREMLEVPYAIKRLGEAGVRLFTYRNGGTEIRFDTAEAKMMLMWTTFNDDMEAQKARQRATDAYVRKSTQGHATGKAPFGYRLERVLGPTGKRSHAQFIVDDDAADIVRRIYRRALDGAGTWRIARELNGDGIASPGGGQWTGTAIRQLVKNPMYRGVREWNRKRVRDQFGKRIVGSGAIARGSVAREEWQHTDVPHLRIVDDVTWYAVAKRFERSAVAARAKGKVRRDCDALYAFTGHLRCAVCGGWFEIRHQRRRDGIEKVYGCRTYNRHGLRGCSNGRRVRQEIVERDLLDAMRAAMTRPTLARDLFDTVRADLMPPSAAQIARRRKDLTRLEREARTLALSLAKGRRVEAVSELLQRTQAQIDDVRAALAADTSRASEYSDAQIKRLIAGGVESLVEKLRSPEHLRDVREGLALALSEPIRMTPTTDKNVKGFEFEGRINTRAFVGLTGVTQNGNYPRAFTAKCNVVFRGRAA
jgi:DNA invertase Pin-like site-specific DNA recombinase